jgi:hypothetical protein
MGLVIRQSLHGALIKLEFAVQTEKTKAVTGTLHITIKQSELAKLLGSRRTEGLLAEQESRAEIEQTQTALPVKELLKEDL